MEGRENQNLRSPIASIDRLDRIESGLRRTNLSGLQDAIKEIGDKIHSVKPGAAGAAGKERSGSTPGYARCAW